jgi:hypothetical protein
MVPTLVHFDRFAQMTFGLEAEMPGFQLVPNGIGLVTGWLAGEGWDVCYAPVSTGWTNCFGGPVTGWTISFAQPTTGWTLCV